MGKIDAYHIAHITMPREPLACSEFLQRNRLSLVKQTNYITGKRNRKISVPEIFDTLKNLETGVIVKVRDFMYLPDQRYMSITVTNNSKELCSDVFQVSFYDYDDSVQRELAQLKRKRIVITERITKIQIFSPKH